MRALTRSPRGPEEFAWDPARGVLAPGALEDVDAVVHLAGEPIGVRWTRARQDVIRSSRVEGTCLLAARLAALERPPRVLVAVSATGWYGNRGDEIVDERSAPGAGFLAALCRDWEDAASAAARAGVRVVHPRLGLVLAARGGTLARMLPVFRLGLGGPLGNGRAWWSWVHLDDVIAVVLRALEDERIAGAVNVVAPAPVRNRDFARALGRALRRPAALPAPAFALRVVFGEMADEALLTSVRVDPARLCALGHAFRFAELDEALRAILRPRSGGDRAA